MARFMLVLLVLIFLQWTLLSYLIVKIHDGKNENRRLTNLLMNQKHESKNPDENNNKDTQQQKEYSPQQDYEGVAVTLMLGSPKWFSRRYTAMINNVLSILPDENWALQLFITGEGLSQEGIELNRGLQRVISSSSKKVILTVIPKEKFATYKKKRYLYYTDEWFWQQLVGDKVLSFGGNGCFCPNSIWSVSNLTQYDFVGTPQGGHLSRFGGGGEFTMRSKAAMIEVIQQNQEELDRLRSTGSFFKEDEFFVKKLQELKKYNVADSEALQKFGGIEEFVKRHEELKPRKAWEIVGPPFSISGTLGNMDHEIRENLLSLCPELKLIFPVLHNPNCFGASVNKEKCASSICALQENAKSC